MTPLLATWPGLNRIQKDPFLTSYFWPVNREIRAFLGLFGPKDALFKHTLKIGHFDPFLTLFEPFLPSFKVRIN